MGSELRGVPVSATEAAPPASLPKVLSSTSTTSTGIRAPLTVDDSDFENSLSGDDNKDGAFSSNESDSDGFLSGEEDGSAQTAGADGKILEKTHFLKEYVISRPAVKIPGLQINKRSSFDRKFVGTERVVNKGYKYNHPTTSSANAREAAVGTSLDEDENATLVRAPGVKNGRAAAMARPVAKLSRDSEDEDDFVSDGSVEDEPFPGVARVSSFGDAGKLGTAPNVRILEAGGGHDSGSEGEPLELEDTLLVRGDSADNGLSNCCLPEKQIAADEMEDRGPLMAEEARSGESCDEIQEFNKIAGAEEVTEAKPEDAPCEVDDEGGEDLRNETEQKLETHDADAPPKYLEAMDNVTENEVQQFMNNVKFSESKDFPEPGFLLNDDVTSGESSKTDLQIIDPEIVADSGNVYGSFSSEDESESSIQLEPSSKTNAEPNLAIFTQKEKMELEKLQEIVVKFLRLVHRLEKPPEDSAIAEVLHQLLLAAGTPYGTTSFNFDIAKKRALVLEGEGTNDLEFSMNVLVIGKSGVGKSATINSMFGEEKAKIDAFELGTARVKEIMGTLDGIRIRVLDTPGFSSSLVEQSSNCKVLSSIKKFTKKFPPDVVLYVDRLDTQMGDPNDLPLLKLITSCLGSSIWCRTIITLTHAASSPPEGPSGDPMSYDSFVAKTSHAVQELISHSAGNSGVTEPSLIPVSLLENCSGMGKESWRSRMLLQCFSMKLLAEIDSVVSFKAPSPEDHGCIKKSMKMDRAGYRAAPLLDRPLLPCFGGENPSHGYHSLWIPVASLHNSFDHVYGYDGLAIEGNLAIAGPAMAAEMRNDRNGVDKGSTAVVEQGIAYILKMETQLRNAKVNETAAARVGENATAELKLEDQLAAVAKDLVFLGSTGLIQDENDTAYEATLGIGHHPSGQDQTLVGISLTRWRGELTCGFNLSSQMSLRPDSKVSVGARLNGKQRGMVSVRLSNSDQPIVAALAFIPIVRTLCRTVFTLLS